MTPGDALIAARARLQAAHAAHADAISALDAAAHAAASARAFLSGIKQEVDRFAEIDRGISTSRAKELKAALKGGTTPTFSAVPALPRNAAARADAENRLEAAKLAVAELEADEKDAERAAKAARDELSAAIMAVVAAAADDLAARILDLEMAALRLRERLGCEFGGLDQAKAPLSLRTIAVIRQNGSTTIMARNTPEWHASNAANSAWKAFAASLESDPAAELNFQTESVNASKAA